MSKDPNKKGPREMTPTERAVLLGGGIVGCFVTLGALAFMESKRSHEDRMKRDQEKRQRQREKEQKRKGPKPPRR